MFVTPEGQFEFCVVPFRLCISLSIFMRCVAHIFRELVRKGTVRIYVDDVIIVANNEEEGMRWLEGRSNS